MDTHNTGDFFFKKDVESAIKIAQKNLFDTVDIIKIQDMDNCEQLKEILKDDELSKKFMIFHENMNKLIRKRVLDATGDLQRQIFVCLEDYKIELKEMVEIKGIVK